TIAGPLDSDPNAPRTASSQTVPSHPTNKIAVHHHAATRVRALTFTRSSARHKPKRIITTITGLATTPIRPTDLKTSANCVFIETSDLRKTIAANRYVQNSI